LFVSLGLPNTSYNVSATDPTGFPPLFITRLSSVLLGVITFKGPFSTALTAPLQLQQYFKI
jgi:hypothetical protein